MGSRGASANSKASGVEADFARRATALFGGLDTIEEMREAIFGSRKAAADELSGEIADFTEAKAKQYGFDMEREGEGIMTSLVASKTVGNKTVYVNPTINNGGYGKFAIRVSDPSYRKPGVRFQVGGRSKYFDNMDSAFKYANKIVKEKSSE